ncbi:hypothetical protein ACFLSQ_04035 [Bacteroidota bacterium]
MNNEKMNDKLRNIAKILLVVMIVGLNQLSAQTNNFGIGTLTPHQSSILQLFSINQGMLIPRMLESERDLIASPGTPATSLLIYQTDGIYGFYYWDGTKWVRISTSVNIDYVYGEGLPGQVGYWETSSTLTGENDFFWDFADSELGIGTTSPVEKVDIDGGMIISTTSNTVSGNIRFTGLDFEGWTGSSWVSFTSNTLFGRGATGQVTFWDAPDNITGDIDLFWNDIEKRLGIGTNTPREALEIAGGMLIGNTNNDVTGNIRWNPATQDFEGYDGALWKSLTESLINGVGEAGQVTFWTDTYYVEGCDDLFWDMTNYRLGIQTKTPRSALEVGGAIIITDVEDEATVQEGTIRWNALAPNDFEGYMGGIWVSFTSAPAIFGSGSPGQVAIWETPTPPTLTGDDDLFWDNTNKFLGVKTNTPEYDMDVKGEIFIGTPGQSGQLRFYSEQGAPDYEVVIQPSSTMTTSTTYTLPPSDGEPADLNLLCNDGTGVMIWRDPTKGFSFYWGLVNNVVIQRNGWALGTDPPTFGGTAGTHLLFGRSTVSAAGQYSTILNGDNNTISSGNYSTIYTGLNQSLTGSYSTILGGSTNSLTNSYSAIFGSTNSVSGAYSIIPGGQNTTLSGAGSFVFKGASGATSISQANSFNLVDIQFHFNESNNNADFRADGQTVDNLIFMDGSADAVGIGTNSPQALLDVSDGDMGITADAPASGSYSLIFYEPSTDGSNYSSFSPASQTATMDYTLPVWHDEENSILVNDGTGVLHWADPGEFAEYLRANTQIMTSGSSYTATQDDNHIIVTSGVDFTVYLPPAAQMNGKEFFVKSASGVNGADVTIQANGAELIEYSNSVATGTEMEGVLLICDGIQWYVAARIPKT